MRAWRSSQLRRWSHTIASLEGFTPSLPRLHSTDLDVFRAKGLDIEEPILLPKGHFFQFPAISKWFKINKNGQPILNTVYLRKYGSVLVPLEITGHDTPFSSEVRPLSGFLDIVDMQQCKETEKESSAYSVYLAQCPLNSLPVDLQADLPTPELVTHAGKGDVYDSSIWIGHAPTYTPLHKDPNPNLFLQLAGVKTIRIFEPEVGHLLYTEARRLITDRGSPSIRGVEMMHGQEKEALDLMVWGPGGLLHRLQSVAYEVQVEPGDAVFIPKGWWHSVKGVGSGIVGSVNWWFR